MRSGTTALVGFLALILAAAPSCGGDSDGSLSRDETELILVLAGWPSGERDAALLVIECESERRPEAVGGEGEAGLFQIHPIHIERFEEEFGGSADPFNPRQNAVVALRLWEEKGWADWATCF